MVSRPQLNGEVLAKLPIRLNWKGLRSDTWAMRGEGWKFRTDTTRRANADFTDVRIVATLPDQSVALVGSFGWSGLDLIQMNDGRAVADWLSAQEVEMRAWVERDRIVVAEYRGRVGGVNYSNFDNLADWDGLATITSRETTLKDLGIFRSDDKAQDVYAPAGVVSECLDRILKVQMRNDLRAVDGKILLPTVSARIVGVS